jgi:hypothetical protein
MKKLNMTTSTPLILQASPQDFMEIPVIEKFNDGSGYKSRLSVGCWTVFLFRASMQASFQELSVLELTVPDPTIKFGP